MASLQYLWKHGGKILKEEIGIDPNPLSINQTVTDMAQTLEDLGRNSLSTALKILIERDLPQEAVAVWINVVWALKQETLCSEAINDFGMALASTRLTSEQDTKTWRETWQQISPHQKVTPNIIYNPANLYMSIFQVGGADTIKRIIREIVLYVRNGSEILLTDYAKLMIRRYRRLIQELTETDKRVLQALLDNPDKSIRDLANLTGVTPSYFSQRVNLMREKLVLLEFDHVPFSKIAIRMYNILLKSRYSKNDALHLIERSPFLYGYRPVLAGDWDYLALFCIPETRQISRWLYRFERLAKQWEIKVTISEIVRSGASTSLRYYQPNGEGWRIPWSALGLWCERQPKCEEQEEEMVLIPYGHRNMRIDELNMKILTTIKRGITSYKAIRDEVGGSQNIIAARLKNLREHKFIVKYIQLLHIGLREGAMIETRDPEMKKILLRLGPKLPRTIISIDRASRIIMTTNLPEGGSVELLKALEPKSHAFSFAFLGDNIYGGWEIPEYSWNPDTQSWMVPEDEVNQWLDSLR
ncbi:MAG: winged helix-turn-helix domain-containing protein [Candidatus Thorarchaeota archaeon]|nr:winged helix-turn-helix domain-containing protein [Candidatus Thorarchaeota archaeon]